MLGRGLDAAVPKGFVEKVAADHFPREGVAVAPFGDGGVIYDAATGRLFLINRAAMRVWHILRRAGAAEAAAVLASSDAVDVSTARRDVGMFVNALRDAGLLERPEPRGSSAMVRLDPPRRQPALEAVYRLGEASTRIVCYSTEVAESFAPLAAPAILSEDAAGESTLVLFRRRGLFMLVRDGRLVDRLQTAPLARWALVRQLVAAGQRRNWLALLHAGAVTTPRGCLLICGDSGAGKSTLLAGLVHAGFAFVSDDILPLEAGSHLAWPVRLAISVKEGSWPVVDPLFPELAAAPVVRLGSRTMRYFWPGSRVIASESVGHPISAILFPRYVEGTSPSLTPLGLDRALVLLGEGGSILPETDAGLVEFLAWLERVPTYELTYGRLEDAIRTIGPLTERLEAGYPHAENGTAADGNGG